jgi:putative oxidoreductase
MRKLFYPGLNEKNINIALLILRLVVAGFMLTHGIPKLGRLFSGEEIQFGDPIGIGPEASLILTVFAEFLCSVLIGIGLGTRLAAIPLIITMAVAAFIAHGADPFGRQELALFYMVVYVVILLTGGGKFSLDYFLFRKNKK